jgi:hypothetical protein
MNLKMNRHTESDGCTITITIITTITIHYYHNYYYYYYYYYYYCCHQPDSSSLGTETIQAGAQLQSRHDTWKVMIHANSATVQMVAPVMEKVYPVGG